jgi:ssDNA-binding replication factor A large subunit
MFHVNRGEVAQAHLRDESVEKLRNLPHEFSTLLDSDGTWRDSPKSESGQESTIGDLRYGSKTVSFKANVIEKSELRAVNSRTGTPLLVCQVTLSDGTGEIPLTIWNDQIHAISKGDTVQVQNAKVRSFRGQKQLMLNRKTGALTVLKSVNNQHARNRAVLVKKQL